MELKSVLILLIALSGITAVCGAVVKRDATNMKIPGAFNENLPVDQKAAIVSPDLDLNKKATTLAPGHAVTPDESETPTNPSSDSDPRPPDTVNPPRKITFDYKSNIDVDHQLHEDDGFNVEVGSEEDMEASQWLVATSSGYEYDGSPDVLREIFTDANFSLSGSIDEMISQYGDPGVDDISEVYPSFDVRSKRRVFREYPRVRVPNPSLRFPWAAMGYVTNNFIHCTGTFIGPRHVLTAGNCVYNHYSRQWIGNLMFFRGKDCDPDQGTYYRAKYSLSVLGWTRDGRREYNYGMIVVDRVSPIYMSYGYRSSFLFHTINIAGYPMDKIGRCIWHTNCPVAASQTNTLEYRCDTYGGMGGSAVYLYWKDYNLRVVYCVNTSESPLRNSCSRITKTRFELFQRWIRDY